MLYRKEIDGLRALAVVPVVLFHAGFNLFSGGFVGVDIFFVISGYLISKLIIKELRMNEFKLDRFYERRARRILPALITVTIASIIFAWFWLLPYDLKDFSQSLFALSTFSSNYLFYIRAGYFESANELKPLLHTWSLAVEEQYYFIYPLLLISIWRFGSRVLITILVIVAISSLILAQYNTQNNPNAGFYLLPSRAFEFLFGAIIAWYLTFRHSKISIACTPYIQQSGSLLGLFLIVFSITFFNQKAPFPGFIALIPTIGTGLIIVFATPVTVVNKILASKVFVGVGLISYSAYLWHQPLFAFARHLHVYDPSANLMIALAIASFILAFFSWKYIEIPFRKDGNFSRNSIFFLSIFSLLVLATIGLLGHYFNGFPSRSPPDYLHSSYLSFAVPKTKNKNGIDGESCVTNVAIACQLTKFDNPKERLLLVGDSHSVDYGNEFYRYAIDKKNNAWQLSIGGCAFLKSQNTRNLGECGKSLDVIRKIVNDNNIDKVIWVGDYYSYGRNSTFNDLEEDIKELTRSIDQIARSTKKLFFLLPRDHLSSFPMRAAYIGDLSSLYVIKENSEKIIKWTSALKQLTFDNPNIEIINQADILRSLGCDDIECFNGHTKDKLPLYRDSNHLTDLGAHLAFNKIKEYLLVNY